MHSLRGMHSTLATGAGATGDLVAKQLGHTSPTVTAAHYTDADVLAVAKQQRVWELIHRDGDAPTLAEKRLNRPHAEATASDQEVKESVHDSGGNREPEIKVSEKPQ